MNKYFKCNVHVGFFFFFLITKFFDKFNSASTLLYQHHNKKHFILFLWYVLVYKWHLDLTILHVCLIFCTVPSFWSIWLHNAVPVSHHKAVHTFSLIQSCIKKSILVLVTCNLLFYSCIDLSEITNAYTCYFEKVYNAVFLTSQHIHVPVHG